MQDQSVIWGHGTLAWDGDPLPGAFDPHTSFQPPFGQRRTEALSFISLLYWAEVECSYVTSDTQACGLTSHAIPFSRLDAPFHDWFTARRCKCVP